MNEGENSGMPNGPIFSSPNIAGSTPPSPVPGQNPQPEQPAAPGYDNPSVTTTVAAIPEIDETPEKATITTSSVKQADGRSFLGGRRRFGLSRQGNATAPQTKTFKNAPEFFNQAMGDIVIADEAAAQSKKSKKKIAIIAVIALLVIGGIIAAVFGISTVTHNSKVSEAKRAWTRFANYVIYGEEKDDPLPAKASDVSHWAVRTYLSVNSEKSAIRAANEKSFYERYNKAKSQIDKIVADKTSIKELDTELADVFALTKLSEDNLSTAYLAKRFDGVSNEELLSGFSAEKEAFSKNYRIDGEVAFYFTAYKETINNLITYRNNGLVDKNGIIKAVEGNTSLDTDELRASREKYTYALDLFYESLTDEPYIIIDRLIEIYGAIK